MANKKSIIEPDNNKNTNFKNRGNNTEIAKLGQKAKNDKLKRVKTMKEQMEILLSLRAPENDVEQMKLLGFTDEECNNLGVIIMALYLRAAAGDVLAIKEIRNIIKQDDKAEEILLKREETYIRNKQYLLQEKYINYKMQHEQDIEDLTEVQEEVFKDANN